MYISSFRINDFGLFSNVQVLELGPGISIFYGDNEAGKSTCLEFLRYMLVGFPSKKAPKRFMPLTGNPCSGSVTLQLGNAYPASPVIRLSRHSEKNELTLYAESGQRMPDNLLENIFTGINRDVYIKVFGFSLSELENFDTLNGAEVQEVLYAASFGAGINSPASVLAKFKTQMDNLYTPKSNKKPINLNFKQLESINNNITELRTANAAYDSLRHHYNKLLEENDELNHGRKRLEKEVRHLERKLTVWKQWEQWHALQMKLEHMPEINGEFPENAIERFSQLQQKITSHEERIAGFQKKIDILKIKIADLTIEENILTAQPQLRQLAERKTSYRQALARIASLKTTIAQAEKELNSNLSRLGPDWNCERIHLTDRSIFTREGMEKAAAEMNTANLEQQSARSTLEKITKDIERITKELNQAKDLLEEKPEPEAILSASERDELRANIGSLENCERQAPLRKQVYEKARAALSRALLPLQIPFQNNDAATMEELETVGKRLDAILSGRAKALALANEVTVINNETERLLTAATSAELRANELQKELYNRQKDIDANAGPTKSALDTRTQALRSLRSLSNNLEKEKDRLKELDERIQIEKSFGRQKNWFLITIGIIFLLISASVCFLYWFMRLTEIIITPQIVVPINPWAGYVALACGLLFCAAGFPGNNSEQKRRKLEIAHLESRRETCAMKIAELGNKSQQLCTAAAVDSMDSEVLNRLEETLQQDKIRLAEDQRAISELNELKKREKEARLNATTLRETSQEKNAELQHIRRAWHELMQSLETGFVPLPEQADAFFARVEGAKTACENAENAERELDALWDDYYILEKAITSLPAISQRLENSSQPMNFKEAVKQALDACHEADAIHAQRQQLLMNVESLEKSLQHENDLHDEALKAFEQNQANLIKASETWNSSISGLGLGNDLSPETVREALGIMEAALVAETRYQEAHRDYELAKKELTELQKPLSEILQKIDYPAIDASAQQTDWLSILDTLLQKAENSRVEQENKNRLEATLAEEQRELSAENASLATIRAKEEALFNQAAVENGEEYIRLAHAQQEKRALQDNIANLEYSLTNAANGMDLKEFLRSFEGELLEEHEQKLETAKNELEKVNAQRDEKNKEIGHLKDQTDRLATETKLATERQQEMNLLEETGEMAKKWATYAMASTLLNEAKRVFEKEKQPEVIRLASAIFKKITNGRWAGFGVSLEKKNSLLILPPEGEPVEPEMLSRGAQEQAYLALRIAYIINRSRTAPALPVIMDEILVNFDPQRAERAARAIAELAASESGGAQQVFYFTCQPHMVEIIKSASPHSPVYTVEKGDISRKGT